MKNIRFIEQIEKLEGENNKKFYITRAGKTPVLLTAPHTINQQKKDGGFKLREPYTKAIAMYVSEVTDSSFIVKIRDTGIDSNSNNMEMMKKHILEFINKNKIKLLLDIHGASEERDFDIELGNLDNLSSDFSTIKELKKSFEEQGIKNIEENNPFKGGGITKIIYGKTDIDVIQIEINKKFRNIDTPEKIEKVCNALINFIEKYKKQLGEK